MREARRLNVTVALIDRDVQVTLNRLFDALSQSDLSAFETKVEADDAAMRERLVKRQVATGDTAGSSGVSGVGMSGGGGGGGSGSGSGGEITADQLRDMVEMIKQRDQVRMLMQGVKDDLPLVYDAMIGERDAYMANGIKRGAGKYKTIVGVVGMAHMDGIERNLDWKSVPCDARI